MNDGEDGMLKKEQGEGVEYRRGRAGTEKIERFWKR